MTTRPSMRRPFPAVTRVGQFMIENGITNERLARHANFSIVTVFKLRRGRSEPHLQTMVAMARAASEIIRPRVRAEEQFTLGDDDDEHETAAEAVRQTYRHAADVRHHRPARAGQG